MLEVREITARYGGIEALHGVSVRVGEDEFISIVGPNGAGKTTLLKSISGTVRCPSGQIYFLGKDISHLPAHARTELGIVHVPEGRRIFPSLTVLENLYLGAYRRQARALLEESLEAVLRLFPVLKERTSQPGGTLSGGEQQMLALGRGLMAVPRLLMLDEPSMGLGPRLADDIFDRIKEIRKTQKVSVLLVEQRAVEALELCDRGYVLESGRVIVNGDREALIGNPVVQKAYLGVL